MIHVVLADRDRLVMQLLARMIDNEPDMCVRGMHTSAHALLSSLQASARDIVVMDPVSLSPSGVEIVSSLRATAPNARVIVLTASQRDLDLFTAVRAGIRGYISKSADAQELLAAIRAAHTGGALISQDRAVQLMDAFASQTYEETGLSPRQRDILEGLVQGKSNREIAADLALSEKTVKNYMRGIFSALGCRDRTEAAIAGLRRGLVPLSGGQDTHRSPLKATG